ncbi:MAG: hypothetical protein NXI29_03510 [bacterium]|uniref:Uncharacterized protein n=1 Tax=Gimesia chilikensis TaxID=2605989 RepID=A0A517PQE1_9PLAN|nr:hypothetical protein [Gimesia chilikensis]MCR9230057.1 hypothetical protein [bacterium]QDT21597.1 hypothetical protein HG66A1_34000 [Gimesia chilikensis]
MKLQNKLMMLMLVVPQSMLVVLLAFDLKYYDASEKAFTVPIYPWPMYLKLMLSVLGMIATSVLLSCYISKQEKQEHQKQDIACEETVLIE